MHKFDFFARILTFLLYNSENFCDIIIIGESKNFSSSFVKNKLWQDGTIIIDFVCIPTVWKTQFVEVSKYTPDNNLAT